jgi:hypothetical protein
MIRFFGPADNGPPSSIVEYVDLYAEIEDASLGSEDGFLAFYPLINGSNVQVAYIGSQIRFGAVAGSDYTSFSPTTGAISQAGTATLTLQDGSDLIISANPDAAPFVSVAGDTMTGQLVTDNLGIEFEESDTNPTCAANNFNLYADNSEQKIKKCVDGTAYDLSPVREICFDAASLHPIPADDSFGPISKEAGTNLDVFLRSFDDSTDECVTGKLSIPADVSTTGSENVTFKLYWKSGGTDPNDVVWDFEESEITDSTGHDGVALTAYTLVTAVADGTADDLSIETGNIDTLTNLGWTTANEIVLFSVCRDADEATDTVSGDADLLMFCVGIPRA